MNALTLPVLLTSIGLCILIDCAICAGEEGDQILDGIGETDLVARYIFSGDAEDASRHNRHATLHGNKGTYVRDDKFGTVLSLSGKDGGYVVIPSQALTGVEAVADTPSTLM